MIILESQLRNYAKEQKVMDTAYVKGIFLDFSYKKHNLIDLSFIKNECMV